jgi:hypothetical protein
MAAPMLDASSLSHETSDRRTMLLIPCKSTQTHLNRSAGGFLHPYYGHRVAQSILILGVGKVLQRQNPCAHRVSGVHLHLLRSQRLYRRPGNSQQRSVQMPNSTQKPENTQKGGDKTPRQSEMGQQNQGGQRNQPGQQHQGQRGSGGGQQTGGSHGNDDDVNRKEGSK